MDRFAAGARLRVGDPASPEISVRSSRATISRRSSPTCNWPRRMVERSPVAESGRHAPGTLSDGFFFEPTVILGLPRPAERTRRRSSIPWSPFRGSIPMPRPSARRTTSRTGLPAASTPGTFRGLIGWRPESMQNRLGELLDGPDSAPPSAAGRRVVSDAKAEQMHCVSSPNPPTSASNWSEPCPH